MPIYEYVCSECSQPSEILLKGRRDKPRCSHCGSAKLQRRFSTFAAHRGGGVPAGKCPAGAEGACRSDKCPLA